MSLYILREIDLPDNIVRNIRLNMYIYPDQSTYAKLASILKHTWNYGKR